MLFEHFPEEIVTKVLLCLDGRDCANIVASCKKMRLILRGELCQSQFQNLCISKWGRLCESASAFCSYEQFYFRRIGYWCPPPSPLNLVQESYFKDAWVHLACCIMCSRTSGGEIIRKTIASFFDLYPTPTEVVEADIGTLRELLLPLGLNRERTLQRFATEFLGTAWVEPDELYGCGKFAADSWRTFCLGHWRTVHRDKRADKNLKAYAAFVARLHSDSAASDAATAGGAPAQEGRARSGVPPAAAAGRPLREGAGAGAADGAAGLAPRVQRRRSNRIKNDDKVDCDEGKSQQQASSKKKMRIENGIELAASSKAGEVAKKRKRYAKRRKDDHGMIKPEKRGTFFQQATTPKRWLLRSTVAASSL